jgi:hypothetical protein
MELEKYESLLIERTLDLGGLFIHKSQDPPHVVDGPPDVI